MTPFELLCQAAVDFADAVSLPDHVDTALDKVAAARHLKEAAIEFGDWERAKNRQLRIGDDSAKSLVIGLKLLERK